MIRVALLSLSICLVTACATQKSSTDQSTLKNGMAYNQDSSTKKGPKVVCTMERETGTNIPERVCRTVDEDADRARRDAIQQQMRDLPNGSAIKGN